MKEAIENLIPLERDLFFLLNGSNSSFLDDWMWTVSGRFIWIPVFLAILFLFFYKTPRKQAMLVTLSSSSCSYLVISSHLVSASHSSNAFAQHIIQTLKSLWISSTVIVAVSTDSFRDMPLTASDWLSSSHYSFGTVV